MAQDEWMLLAYRMPREPSTPRIAVWRKLRKLGALQVVDGCVALPADPATAEALDWLAEEVIEAGGEAWTWRARPTSKQQQADLRARCSQSVTAEYEALVMEAAEEADVTARSLGRLRRQLRAIEQRDYFRVPARDMARGAVEGFAARIDEAMSAR